MRKALGEAQALGVPGADPANAEAMLASASAAGEAARLDDDGEEPKVAYIWPGTTRETRGSDPELEAARNEGNAPSPDAFANFALGQLTAVRQSNAMQERTPVVAKIEKNRPENNGVKRPSAGTVCAAVWDTAATLSTLSESGGNHTKVATLSEVTKACEAKGINKFTARTQYARWRVFNGITGRLL